MIRKKSHEVKKESSAAATSAPVLPVTAAPASETRDYSITVNGRVYQVQVSSGGTVSAAPGAESTPVSPPTATATSAIEILAPTPGNIVRVEVAVGDIITKDQVLLVMEAMKMESEVKSPQSGVLQAIHVQAGDTVQTGDVLLTLGE